MIKKGLLFFIFCIICEEVLAGVFSVVPTDKSQQYLGIVFGGNVGAINLGGGSFNPTLSLMFERFNFIIVSIGAIVLSYIGIASTINTAREGEALGKKISLWVPLRAFTGMLLMVPGPTSGYSLVQMTVLWIVLNGIGAANAVWNVVLGQLAQNVSAIGGLNIQISPTDLVSTTQAVLNASTCMYSINSYMPELSTVPNSPFANYGPVRIYTNVQTPIPAPNSTGANLPTQISQSAIVSIGLQGAQPPYDTLCGFFTVTTSVSSTDTNNNFNYATVAQRLAIKTAALQAMFSAVDAASQLLASPTPAGPQYAQPDPGYVFAAGQAYIGQIAQLATGIKATPGSSAQSWEATSAPVSALTGNYEILQSYGWIQAGSYYYAMVSASGASLDNETKPGSAKFPSPSGIPVQTTLSGNNQMPSGGNGWPTINMSYNTALTNLLAGAGQTTKLNTALQHATTYWTIDQQQASGPPTQGISIGSPDTGNDFMNAVVKGIANKIQTPILNYIQGITAGGSLGSASVGNPISSAGNTVSNASNNQYVSGLGLGGAVSGLGGALNSVGSYVSSIGGPTYNDPLLAIGQFGSTLMLTAELAVFSALVASIGISLAVSSGSCVSPFAWGANLLLVQLVPLIYGITIMLWTAGATLGIYIPLVPYLIFTTSAFGWIIAVIEAVVGAPLVALGLVHPSDGELGKLGGALLILANVFLRPTLMIFGFVLGGGLLRAGIALINFGFVPALAQTTPSIFSVIAILVLYMFLIMAIVNKSFSLIYMLPNQIMRWAGGTPEQFEPGEMVKEAKTGFDTGAGKAQEFGAKAHESATTKLQKASEGKEKPQLPSPRG